MLKRKHSDNLTYENKINFNELDKLWEAFRAIYAEHLKD